MELSKAHIPMISPTASSDLLSNFPFFFQIAPPASREGIIGAHYAEQQLHARRVALFFDPEDPDSFSLARAFQKQFIADGDQIVVTEKYTTGKPETLPEQLRDAISDAPDLLYFAGHSDDMSVILTDLPSHSSDLQIMGGNALFQLQGYSSSSQISFSRLHFTAFAYSDAWDSLKLTKQKPVFFTLYQRYFDPNQQHISPQTSYGYDLPDSEAILSYDALSVLLYGSKNALQTNNSVLTSDTLQQSLKKITGSQAFQGVSGQISFDSENKPINKTVIVLSLAQNGQIVLDNHFGIQGCFFLPGSCTESSPG
jgi:ABC-type branched-subunit amino acid transport system substrate-binding protein